MFKIIRLFLLDKNVRRLKILINRLRNLGIQELDLFAILKSCNSLIPELP